MKGSDSGSSLEAWTRALARPTIAPAGGSAAAIAGAMAASLVAMVAGLMLERERYAGVHLHAAHMRDAAEQLRIELLELASEDARIFADFGDALGLPAETENERDTREAAKRHALAEGARIQLEIARRVTDLAVMGDDLATAGPPSAVVDAATAVFLATAAARSTYWAARNDLGHEIEGGWERLRQTEVLQQRVTELLRKRFGN